MKLNPLNTSADSFFLVTETCSELTRFGEGTGKPSLIYTSLTSQLRNSKHLRHLKSKTPFLKVELGHDLTPNNSFLVTGRDEAAPRFCLPLTRKLH